jgi:hypothetical protein
MNAQTLIINRLGVFFVGDFFSRRCHEGAFFGDQVEFLGNKKGSSKIFGVLIALDGVFTSKP